MKEIVKIIIILLLATSCNNSNNKEYMSIYNIIDKRPIEKGDYIKYSTGEIKSLIDTFSGKHFGNYFNFYKNGYLSDYYFLTDTIHSTYSEKFDSITHNVINIKGSPIVYKIVDVDKHPGSIYVEYWVTNFSYTDIEFSLSQNGKDFTNEKLNDYVQLKYINAIYYIKDMKNSKRFYLIAKFKARLKNSSILKSYYDTIDISKRLN